jgi:hypothetical protein
MDDKERGNALAIRQNRKIINDCVNALGDYAALLVADKRNSTTAPAKKLRETVSEIVQYWGLDENDNDKSVEDYLNDFDDKVDTARIKGVFDVDTHTVCSDSLTGLAMYGEDLIGVQGSDAMHEILKTADLLNKVGEYFGFVQETEFAENSARWLRNSVAGMLKEYDLPGIAVTGLENQGYEVKQAIFFDNDMGFAFGHNPQAASPFVTWQTFYDKSKINIEFEWGKYFSTEEKALVDYIMRHMKYEAENNVKAVALPVTAESEQDEWRTYRAEIELRGEEYPHFEVFGADNDVDAVKKANELCNERENAVLLEVREIDDKYESIRQIDLRYHDPEARRFMDVDIIDFLGQIAEKTIIHHPNDFKIDVDALWRAALSKNPEDKRLMWHCCSYGTHILDECDVFIKNTGAHGTWVDYRPNDEDMFGYAIEVTGYKDDTVIGNVYEVGNYSQHAHYVHENALVLDSVSLTYSPDWGINAGKTITVPRHEYDNDRHRLMSESGSVAGIKYHPSESVKTMADLLEAEKAKYMGMPVGDTKEHLAKLDKTLLELREELDTEDNLRIYHAEFIDPEISDRFEAFAAKDDNDALEQAKEMCEEADGIVLSELYEVDMEGNNINTVYSLQVFNVIMPDPTITVADRNNYGCTYDEILPLNQNRAIELYMQENQIYLLWSNDATSVANDLSEITNHKGIFGIDHKVWIISEAYKDMVSETSQKELPMLQAAEKQTKVMPQEQTTENTLKRKHRGEER